MLPKAGPDFQNIHKAGGKISGCRTCQDSGFVLDPVGPLARVIHALKDSGDSFTMDEAHSALCDAVKLLGNASSQISKLRRRKILRAVNPDIQDLAEEEIFTGAVPDIFGQGLEAKMKERAESLKLISAVKPRWPQEVFLRGLSIWPPERWRPSQPWGEKLVEQTDQGPTLQEQEVAPQIALGRDLNICV